jgi:rare lipoprotein A
MSGCGAGERITVAYYSGGGRTASGQRFDPHGLTAAHRTLPFGTRLVVINPRNGKSVTVTVNDRGPFVRGVTLDVTLGAARVIGITGTGTICMAKAGNAT